MRFGLKENTISEINRVLSTFPEVERAILYGSRAMGREKPASDIDLTLEGEALTGSIIGRIDWALDDLLLPYTFDLSIYHKLSNPDVVNHIKRVGKIFYDKRIFVSGRESME